MSGKDWMDDLDDRAKQQADSDRIKARQQIAAEQAFADLATAFVLGALTTIDEDVKRWNARPNTPEIAALKSSETGRSYKLGDRTLTVRYSAEFRLLEVSIEVGNGVYIAPNIGVDSYELVFDRGWVVAKRQGSLRRGWVDSAADISREILSALIAG